MTLVGKGAGRKLTREEIDLFENAKDIRQLTFLGVRLVDEQCDYEPRDIARYAIEKEYGQKLGYLAEISLEAAKKMRIGNIERLEKLLTLLPTEQRKFTFLFPYRADESQLKSTVKERSHKSVNRKWGIYSFIGASDIEEYIELYLIDLRQGNYVKVMGWK